MRYMKIAVIAAIAAMAFAGSASATTLEVGGVTKNESVALEATIAGSLLLTDSFGFFANTCKRSTVIGSTSSPYTGTRVGGPISSLSFSECTEEPIVVDAAGSLEVEHIAGTTNGTVFSKNAKVTVPSPFGTLSCVTSSVGTDIGKLTGVSSGNATMDISAMLNCGFMTAKWTGTYLFTSPGGLGVEG